ncbi:RelA/SpoT domain-containing protein [Maricaulis sp.]|uniref:RelA/SpoT domain-containing protein n=1 Tax=Maricaulis sp. TaxID=1486257 RepID=UPI003A8DC0F2
MAKPSIACPYSRKEIVEAGKVLRGSILIDDDRVPENVVNAFRIAHAWRHTFEVPMRDVRQELSSRNTFMNLGGSSAGRLKRMSSIRRKLNSRTLYDIQDIGGCRIILPSMKEVDAMSAYYCDGKSRHQVGRENDYIAAPRATGYRSRHFILKINGFDDDRQKIEVQVRTKLQHAWATAVEAAGLWLREDLKAGEGDPRWLRLFTLMAQKLAEEESACGIPGVGTFSSVLRRELCSLEAELSAIAKLDGLCAAFKSIHPARVSGMLLLEFDPSMMRLTVSKYSWANASDPNLRDELNSRSNSVVVDVDSIEDLKVAYPNYFFDVGLFLNRLRRAVGFSVEPVKSVQWPSGAWRLPAESDGGG